MKLTKDKLSELLEEPSLDFRKENLIAKCPKCGYKEFGISLSDNHRFGCYRKKKCGYSGNIFTLLHLLGKYDEYITRGEVYSVTEKRIVESKIKSVLRDDIELIELPEIEPPIGWRRTFDNEYLNSRGFQDIDYHKFPVGITKLDSKLENYIIFLIQENGKSKATVGRHIWTKKEIDSYNAVNERKIARYKNSSGGVFEQLILGLEDLSEETQTLIIVEGIFDKKNIDSLLELDYQSEVKCIGTFKCHISPSQLKKIKLKAPNIKNIILLYDNDVLKEIITTASILEDNHYTVDIAYNEEILEDAGDLSLSQLDILLTSLWKVYDLSARKIQKKRLF